MYSKKFKPIKKIFWIGSSKKDLSGLSEEVQHDFGYGLYLAQIGGIAENSKPLKGFGKAGVIELIAEDHDGSYRAVYTINFPELVYVLHVFQKKSKHGIETPKRDLELIEMRLKVAQADYKKKMQK